MSTSAPLSVTGSAIPPNTAPQSGSPSKKTEGRGTPAKAVWHPLSQLPRARTSSGNRVIDEKTMRNPRPPTPFPGSLTNVVSHSMDSTEPPSPGTLTVDSTLEKTRVQAKKALGPSSRASSQVPKPQSLSASPASSASSLQPTNVSATISQSSRFAPPSAKALPQSASSSSGVSNHANQNKRRFPGSNSLDPKIQEYIHQMLSEKADERKLSNDPDLWTDGYSY